MPDRYFARFGPDADAYTAHDTYTAARAYADRHYGPDADQREQNPYLSTEAWRSAHAITPKPNRPELVARDVARDLAPAALADWPQPYPAP